MNIIIITKLKFYFVINGNKPWPDWENSSLAPKLQSYRLARKTFDPSWGFFYLSEFSGDRRFEWDWEIHCHWVLQARGIHNFGCTGWGQQTLFSNRHSLTFTELQPWCFSRQLVWRQTQSGGTSMVALASPEICLATLSGTPKILCYLYS